jgi:hypothetical protein
VDVVVDFVVKSGMKDPFTKLPGGDRSLLVLLWMSPWYSRLAMVRNDRQVSD